MPFMPMGGWGTGAPGSANPTSIKMSWDELACAAEITRNEGDYPGMPCDPCYDTTFSKRTCPESFDAIYLEQKPLVCDPRLPGYWRNVLRKNAMNIADIIGRAPLDSHLRLGQDAANTARYRAAMPPETRCLNAPSQDNRAIMAQYQTASLARRGITQTTPARPSMVPPIVSAAASVAYRSESSAPAVVQASPPPTPHAATPASAEPVYATHDPTVWNAPPTYSSPVRTPQSTAVLTPPGFIRSSVTISPVPATSSSKAGWIAFAILAFFATRGR